MNPIHPYQRLNRMLAVDKRDISNIYLFALVSGMINLTLPLGIQAIINLIMVGQVASSFGVLVGFVTVGVALAGGMQVMQLALAENIKQKIFARAAFEFAYRLPRLHADSLAGRYMPEQVNRFFDIITVQKGLTKVLMDVPIALLQMLLGLILLSFYHPFFIAFGLVLVVIVWAIFRWSGKRGLETNMKESKYKYEVASWLEEVARTNASFKLAGSTPLPLERTNELSIKYVEARTKHFKVLMGQYLSMVGFKTLVTLVLLLLGGLLVMNEQMNIGQFVAAEIVILLIIAAVEKLTLSIESIYDVLTALDKIGQVTDLDMQREGGMTLPTTPNDTGMMVEFRSVGFRSPLNQRVVVGDIRVKVSAGERVCLVGPPGSGKSTLLRTIAGLVDPSEGVVLVDGHPVQSLDLIDLRSRIGDCLTSDGIFAGSILDNITMRRPGIGDLEVQDVLRLTGLQHMLGELPQGVLTVLDPQATSVPQSMIDRLLLARCLAGNPRLVLIEEHLSLLSADDRDRVLDRLLDPARPWTVILVSNDPNIIKRFPRKLILQDGTLIEG